MSFWKELASGVTHKTQELAEEAKKRAAKKATEAAVGTGKAVAKAALKGAAKTLDYAGKQLEAALFGEPEPGGARERPDPFAKLKAEEIARKAAAAELKAKERVP